MFVSNKLKSKFINFFAVRMAVIHLVNIDNHMKFITIFFI
jgi:hypothetical protein